jgi:acyl-CoA reductase-like NAD-dependent aldehyde dehydrogenase
MRLQTIADAYRKAFPHTKSWKDKSVHERSSKLFNSAKIVSRLAELKAELASAYGRGNNLLKEIATRQEDKDQGIAMQTASPA